MERHSQCPNPGQDDLMAVLDKRMDGVGSDESSGAGDRYPHGHLS